MKHILPPKDFGSTNEALSRTADTYLKSALVALEEVEKNLSLCGHSMDDLQETDDIIEQLESIRRQIERIDGSTIIRMSTDDGL